MAHSIQKINKILFIIFWGLSFVFPLAAQTPILDFDIPGEYREALYGSKPALDQPSQSAVGDFNKDGIPDRAEVFPKGNRLSQGEFYLEIFLGLAEGGDTSIAVLPIPILPYYYTDLTFSEIFIGNFDHDNQLDLVVFTNFLDFASDFDNSLFQFYYGNGDGTFELAPEQTEITNRMAVGDLDKDGLDDLVYFYGESNQGFGDLVLAYAKGDRTFRTVGPLSYSLEETFFEPFIPVLKDFDQDGYLDLWIGGDQSFNYEPVFINRGDGSFENGHNYKFTDERTQLINTFDMNKDGLDDLVLVTNENANDLNIVINKGNGIFQLTETYTFESPISKVFIADLNTDNQKDFLLCFSSDEASSMRIMFGQENAQYILGEALDNILGQVSIVENLDQNSGAELISQNQSQTLIYANDGQGNFSLQSTLETSADQILLGNFDNDTKKDLLAILNNSSTLKVYHNLGNLQFSDEEIIAESVYGRLPENILVDDLNQDGMSDIVGIFRENNEYATSFLDMTVLLNNGDNTFEYSEIPNTIDYPSNPLLADLNGDNFLDIINPGYSTQFTSGYFETYMWSVTEVSLGRGDGTFSSRIRFNRNISSSVLGNFNNDRLLDIATPVINANANVNISFNRSRVVNAPITCEGDILLSNQAAIDGFDCEIITGKLTIEGNDITNLSKLQSLKEVRKDMIIKNNPLLTSSEGIRNLTKIGGNLHIENNPNLAELQSLANLETLNGDLKIIKCHSLENLIGISLNTLERLQLEENNSLVSLQGLENLENINYLKIEENPKIESLEGLSNLTSLNHLEIITSNNLQSLKGLRGFKQSHMEGLKLVNNPLIENLDGFESLRTITSLKVIGNALLSNLEAISNVTQIDFFTLSVNESLTSLNAFRNLRSSDWFSITGMYNLTSLDGLENLERITRYLYLFNNEKLTDCCAIAELISKTQGNKSIFGNATGCTNQAEIETYCASITRLDLVDAKTGEFIQTISEGDTINLNGIGDGLLTIEAISESETIRSVQLELTGALNHSQIENISPFTLFGNDGDNFQGKYFPVGSYKINATPFEKIFARGVMGNPLSLNFHIINEVSPNYVVTQFNLINTINNQVVQTLTNGAVVDLSSIGNIPLSIEAVTEPRIVGKVHLNLEGPIQKSKVEIFPPYTLFGNNSTLTQGSFFPVGNYSITAIPFSKRRPDGEKGIGLSLHFEVMATQNILIYPNPASRQIKIISTINPQEKKQWNIYDKFGRLQLSGTLTQQLFVNIEHLELGIYLLEVVSSNQVDKASFIKE